jgi:hypothetical protein
MRTTITLPKRLFDLAERRMEELAFTNIKEYVQHLIRQDTVLRPHLPATNSGVVPIVVKRPDHATKS